MYPVWHFLLLFTLVRNSKSQGYVGNEQDFAGNFGNPFVTHPANYSGSFYGIMFDAGSTGTRIHIYTFTQKEPGTLPILYNEIFQSVEPGLSAYADNPENAGHTVWKLLEVAKNTVPRIEWKRTPVMLKATAGLRMLPAGKAHALLEQVQAVFEKSPFSVPVESVSIMDGTSEGILAWVTLNYLTGSLYYNTKKSVGILDLGGGSTQISFLPKSKATIQNTPTDYLARFSMFNATYTLYTHSYPKNGIKAAQLSALGALGSKVSDLEWKVFHSSCLPENFKGKMSFGDITYKVSGDPEGSTGYKSCYNEMLKTVKDIIQLPVEDHLVFYAFSYYFDHAVEAGLIDRIRGGAVQVQDFQKRAKEVCTKGSTYSLEYPFLCMDLTYITCLLKEGYGFKEDTVLELTRKLNNVETSWALGATIGHFQHFKIF